MNSTFHIRWNASLQDVLSKLYEVLILEIESIHWRKVISNHWFPIIWMSTRYFSSFQTTLKLIFKRRRKNFFQKLTQFHFLNLESGRIYRRNIGFPKLLGWNFWQLSKLFWSCLFHQIVRQRIHSSVNKYLIGLLSDSNQLESFV